MLAAALAVLVLAAAPATAQVFEPADIIDWRRHRFAGETAYALVERAGRPAIHAVCAASASGLFREGRIDLTATPVIEWRWRVEAVLPPGPGERTRAGDDFPARLYVVREGLLPWQTRALNYVWASREPVGADWPNPFARQAHMVVVESGPGDGWRTARRDIRADFQRFHGLATDRIDAVAIMTDCDNTGGRAEAWYGTIRFLPAE